MLLNILSVALIHLGQSQSPFLLVSDSPVWSGFQSELKFFPRRKLVVSSLMKVGYALVIQANFYFGVYLSKGKRQSLQLCLSAFV